MRRWPLIISLFGPLALTLGVVAGSQASPSVGHLRTQINRAAQREQALAAGAQGGAALIGALSQQLAVLSERSASVQQQLAQDRVRLRALSSETGRQRLRVGRLRAQLIGQRAELAQWLVAVYEQGRPDALEVLTSVHGFGDLLDRMDFLNRLSEHGGQITMRISAARAAARRALARVVSLDAAQRVVTAAAATESAALQSMSGALAQRRAALGRARQLQLAELSRTRSQRSTLQSRLAQALAALTALPTVAGPGTGSTTGFAIPWPIVQCESGGQNLPPNAAGASGYYQILASTWKGAGGSTAQAYQAPKAEQDAVAARLWAGGAGAANWVCASLIRTG